MPKNEIQIQQDAERKASFLEHLAISSHVTASARAANISLSTLYRWRENDADFYKAWMKALSAGYELLEMELLQRAREGVEKTIFFGGEVIATVREYDNGMSLRLLALHKDMVALTRLAQTEAIHISHKFNALGDLELFWVRRTSAGSSWFDHVEAPLAEETEKYQLVWKTAQNSVLGTEDVSTPVYSISEQQLSHI